MSEEVLKALTERLHQEGLAQSSPVLARVILECALVWRVPAGDPRKAEAILALSFGSRLDQAGGSIPGPINEALAERAVKYYGRLRCRVFAQWEVAECLKGRVAEEDLTSILPLRDSFTGAAQYLSTRGVLEQAAAKLPRGKRVLIIAHRDHLCRCAALAGKAGFHPIAVQDDMPAEYDAESRQRWTSSRERYLISDVISRLSACRDEMG